ncbi:MAG: sporulation transcriptional regulator SpoIIID [Clostridia bacterium]|nr:sporulation transcriptional regulator SpoIIID [Clostridia bacterium]
MFYENIEQRAIELAHYIIETGDTVRGAAKKFAISKSTVHKDVTSRLEHINPPLFLKVKDILALHKDERHIRGGIATQKKYLAMKK